MRLRGRMHLPSSRANQPLGQLPILLTKATRLCRKMAISKHRRCRRLRTALARVVQVELANLKRMYKIDGLTEAEIHAIIPDRPVGKKMPKP